MGEVLTSVAIGAAVFASTNVDDLFLLAAFFAAPNMRASTVVAGQLLGIGALTAASAAAALASFAVPEGYIALLGVVPLAIGVWHFAHLFRTATDESESTTSRGERSSMWTVAGVTIANGGDNLGTYIPMFARNPDLVPLYAAVFAVLTVVWCCAGYALVNHPLLATPIRRYGDVVLPVVLIALGLWILSDARVLLG